MLDIRINLLKNRLYITIGRARKNKLESSIHILENATKKLTSGFTCITRITDCRGFDSKDDHFYERVEKLLSDRGMARLVRIGDGDAQAMNASNCVLVDTLDAAEQILEQWETSRKESNPSDLQN